VSLRHSVYVYIYGGKGGQCIGLTTLPPSRADCLDMWEPLGNLGPVMGLLYLIYIYINFVFIQ